MNATAIASELDKLQTGGLTPVPTPNVHISVQTVAAELVGTDEGSALASEQDAALVLNYSLTAVRLLDAADAEVPETVLKGVLDLASEVLAAAGEEGCQGFGELQDMVAQLAVVNQFIILPLSFLSGTFYRIDVLPEVFQTLIMGNPLFYLIDGFRYGFTGETDANLMVGVAFIAVMNIALFLTVGLVLRGAATSVTWLHRENHGQMCKFSVKLEIH